MELRLTGRAGRTALAFHECAVVLVPAFWWGPVQPPSPAGIIVAIFLIAGWTLLIARGGRRRTSLLGAVTLTLAFIAVASVTAVVVAREALIYCSNNSGMETAFTLRRSWDPLRDVVSCEVRGEDGRTDTLHIRPHTLITHWRD